MCHILGIIASVMVSQFQHTVKQKSYVLIFLFEIFLTIFFPLLIFLISLHVFLPHKRNVGISLKSVVSDMSELPDMSMMTVTSLMSVISVISEMLPKWITVF